MTLLLLCDKLNHWLCESSKIKLQVCCDLINTLVIGIIVLSKLLSALLKKAIGAWLKLHNL